MSNKPNMVTERLRIWWWYHRNIALTVNFRLSGSIESMLKQRPQYVSQRSFSRAILFFIWTCNYLCWFAIKIRTFLTFWNVNPECTVFPYLVRFSVSEDIIWNYYYFCLNIRVGYTTWYRSRMVRKSVSQPASW